jgi:hypothetical protein
MEIVRRTMLEVRQVLDVQVIDLQAQAQVVALNGHRLLLSVRGAIARPVPPARA